MIVVLNGAPRSGKSSIVEAMQRSLAGIWMNLGVDLSRRATPAAVQPGIGLRPGEALHPAAEAAPLLYAALWESVAAHDRLGLNVAVDVGLYDPVIAADAARRLAGSTAFLVGVRCPVDVVVERRRQDPAGFATDRAAAELWEREVHRWPYDLEVDTSLLSPEECVEAIRARLDADPPPVALSRLDTFLA